AIFNWILVTLFILGVLSAVFFAKRHYSPIQTLHHSVGEILPVEQVHPRNELDLIKRALTTTVSRNVRLAAKVDEMKLYIKLNFFISLLRGNIKEVTEEDLHSMGLHPQGKYYCVMALFPKAGNHLRIEISSTFPSESIHVIDLTQE